MVNGDKKYKEIIIGNSAPNHANGGLFCIIGDRIAYSQLNEQGSVYLAEVDGAGKELLIENGAYNLYSVGDDLYYQKMCDNSVWRCNIVEKEQECILANEVKDLIVTNRGLYYLIDDIYWMDFATGEQTAIVTSKNIRYIDYFNSNIYYTTINDNGLLDLYQKECLKQGNVIFENIRGFVVSNGVLYYTNRDNELIMYNISSKLSENMGIGYNVQERNGEYYFLCQGKIYKYNQNGNSQEISDVYNVNYDGYEVHSYYICQDYMYMIVYDEECNIYRYIGINLQNKEVFDM